MHASASDGKVPVVDERLKIHLDLDNEIWWLGLG
jgi:hypothetical protein